jgi:hypothetical protein
MPMSVRVRAVDLRDALIFIEKHALFTREGPEEGVRQVNERGLVAAAFTHRDSRGGDLGSAHPCRRRQQQSADF